MLVDRRYPVVLADPPWIYYGDPGKDQAAGKHYRTMENREILDVFPGGWPICDPGVLFLWSTCPMLERAISLGGDLGLHYRGVAFVWVKTRRDGSPIGAQGVRPSIVKPTTEIVLAFSSRKRGRPLPLSSESVVQVVMAPRRAHSEKPDEVQERIESLYPSLPKLEVFARRRRPGWDSFGDEVDEC